MDRSTPGLKILENPGCGDSLALQSHAVFVFLPICVCTHPCLCHLSWGQGWRAQVLPRKLCMWVEWEQLIGKQEEAAWARKKCLLQLQVGGPLNEESRKPEIWGDCPLSWGFPSRFPGLFPSPFQFCPDSNECSRAHTHKLECLLPCAPPTPELICLCQLLSLLCSTSPGLQGWLPTQSPHFYHTCPHSFFHLKMAFWFCSHSLSWDPHNRRPWTRTSEKESLLANFSAWASQAEPELWPGPLEVRISGRLSFGFF